MFQNIYHGKKVLVTGHTGFKGSWLAAWLIKMGAQVHGLALPMEGEFNHFDLLKLDMTQDLVDIRDLDKVCEVVAKFRPEIVFHMAAQPLVRLSYREPVATFASNVMGTVHVLEACRLTDSVKAIVAVSSDKCYENREWLWGYRENEAMGGYDPYSASKGCTELVISSYRRSFFHPQSFGQKHHTLLASGRAGNVIGGGDWAQDRLVPDIMKAAAKGEAVEIRNPGAVRPWQHVLEPLGGYLLLGQQLLQQNIAAADGWNFGPDDSGIITVEDAAKGLTKYWDKVNVRKQACSEHLHEANLLRLDCSKARHELKWHGVWSPEETFRHTALWYKDFYANGKLNTFADLDAYMAAAAKQNLPFVQ